MEAKELLEVMHLAERLKDTPRHCYTSKNRRESVGEHSWRLALLAMLVADEFPDADMDKVIRMCLIHDLGEMFTGDIPVFNKTAADEAKEEKLLAEWVATLPAPFNEQWAVLYEEMADQQTVEARIYKALDGLEAIIQHNEADISTWADNEYKLNMTYADNKVAFSPYLSRLRQAVRQETEAKIAESGYDMTRLAD